MKNIIKTFMAILSVAALTSCNDILDLSSEYQMTPETYFKTEAECEQWTNYMYSSLESPNTLAAANADDMVDSGLGDVLMATRSASEESWSWSILRRINYFLQNSYRCTDESVRNEYNGVSYFFRAYFYFIKVRRYGDVPWYNQVLGSADEELLKQARNDRGEVMDSVINDLDRAYNLLSATKDGVHVNKYTALALKTRAALYEGTWRKYRNLPNADKYLQAAADAGQKFIDESGYSLYSTGTTPYRDLFSSDNFKSNEVILAQMFSQAASVMNQLSFQIGNQRMGFTKRFMNHYLMADGTRFSDQPNYATMEYYNETQNRDPRMAQTVLCPGYVQVGETSETLNDLTAYTGYLPIKYVAEKAYDGSNKGINDYPLFRAAEVYLNFAEAKAELGTLTQTDLDKSINKIRARAKMPDLNMAAANASPDALLASYYPNVNSGANKGVILEIRRERTIELAMEGFRLWDIFRWKEGKQLEKGNAPMLGCYFSSADKEYDMNGDGTNDLCLYTTSTSSTVATKKQVGKDLVLSGTAAGNIVVFGNIQLTDFDENRDYLWPIPTDQRVLNHQLTQNTGWYDGLDF